MTRFFDASSVILFIVISLAVIIAGCSSPAPASPAPTASPTPVPAATTSGSTPVMTMVNQVTTAMTTPQATSPPSSSGGGQSAAVTLTAENFLFDQKTITVPAGSTVIMTFINKDAGVPHNFALYTDTSATKKIFSGEIINGVKTVTYTFTAPSTPGNYFFRCDVHPTIMFGTFAVT